MLDGTTNHLSKAKVFYHLHYSNYVKLYHSIIINIGKVDHDSTTYLSA